MNKKRDIIIFVVMALTCFIFFRSLKDCVIINAEDKKYAVEEGERKIKEWLKWQLASVKRN